MRRWKSRSGYRGNRPTSSSALHTRGVPVRAINPHPGCVVPRKREQEQLFAQAGAFRWIVRPASRRVGGPPCAWDQAAHPGQHRHGGSEGRSFPEPFRAQPCPAGWRVIKLPPNRKPGEAHRGTRSTAIARNARTSLLIVLLIIYEEKSAAASD